MFGKVNPEMRFEGGGALYIHTYTICNMKYASVANVHSTSTMVLLIGKRIVFICPGFKPGERIPSCQKPEKRSAGKISSRPGQGRRRRIKKKKLKK